MTHYNMLSKRDKDKPYIIFDFVATKLSEKQFNRLKELNPDILGDYYFIPYAHTDFTWWGKCTKYLTNRRLSQAYFSIDYFGNITKY